MVLYSSHDTISMPIVLSTNRNISFIIEMYLAVLTKIMHSIPASAGPGYCESPIFTSKPIEHKWIYKYSSRLQKCIKRKEEKPNDRKVETKKRLQKQYRSSYKHRIKKKIKTTPRQKEGLSINTERSHFVISCPNNKKETNFYPRNPCAFVNQTKCLAQMQRVTSVKTPYAFINIIIGVLKNTLHENQKSSLLVLPKLRQVKFTCQNTRIFKNTSHFDINYYHAMYKSVNQG